MKTSSLFTLPLVITAAAARNLRSTSNNPRTLLGGQETKCDFGNESINETVEGLFNAQTTKTDVSPVTRLISLRDAQGNRAEGPCIIYGDTNTEIDSKVSSVQKEFNGFVISNLTTSTTSTTQKPAPGDKTPAPGDKTPAPGDNTPAPGDNTPAPGDNHPNAQNNSSSNNTSDSWIGVGLVGSLALAGTGFAINSICKKNGTVENQPAPNNAIASNLEDGRGAGVEESKEELGVVNNVGVVNNDVNEEIISEDEREEALPSDIAAAMRSDSDLAAPLLLKNESETAQTRTWGEYFYSFVQ